jgi:hypothetical protein
MKATTANEPLRRSLDASESGCWLSLQMDVASEVSRRQQARWDRVSGRGPVLSPTSGPPSVPRPGRWAHVPLGELFAEQGNHLHARGDWLLECGHEPTHGSKSGRCVLLNPATGRWLCRSCGERGDAITFVMALGGISYQEAAARLTQRFGHGPGDAHRSRRKSSPRWLEA